MNSLLHNLRTFGIDHDDRTVGVEAADLIERQRDEIAGLRTENARLTQIAAWAEQIWQMWDNLERYDRGVLYNHVLALALEMDRFPQGAAPDHKTTSAQPTFDLVAHLVRQQGFSARIFGPGPRTAGVLAHIRKELVEIESQPDDLEEWIDVVLLALDGAWRAGHAPAEIAQALAAKQAKNEQRTWPDWRQMPRDQAIEHVRTDPQDQSTQDPETLERLSRENQAKDQELERLRAEIARLTPLAARAESAMPSVRYRIKLNGYGRLLQGHWFWLDPADDYADLALKQHIANERVGLETALAPEGQA